MTHEAPARIWSIIRLTLVMFGWFGLVVQGMTQLVDYQARAGVAATAPDQWPVTTRIATTPNEPRLVLFMHPHCPCSRATLEELARLAARTDGALRASVLFVIPPGLDPGWSSTDLWHDARAIPGIRVAMDPGGEEAQRFGSTTSGQVLFYDAAGQLRFSGGITAGRGHVGYNIGSDAVAALVIDPRRDQPATRVYGCELMSPDAGRNGRCDSCRK